MMNYRCIVFPLTEIALDHQAIAAALTRDCQRPGARYRITGVCQTAGHVCFPCERADQTPACRYVLAPIDATDADTLTADLHTRWVAGFTTLGMIDLDQIQLGLFAIPATDESAPAT